MVDTTDGNGQGVLFNAVATTSPCFKNRIIFNQDGVSEAVAKPDALLRGPEHQSSGHWQAQCRAGSCLAWSWRTGAMGVAWLQLHAVAQLLRCCRRGRSVTAAGAAYGTPTRRAALTRPSPLALAPTMRR